jgi:hypothetical protein
MLQSTLPSQLAQMRALQMLLVRLFSKIAVDTAADIKQAVQALPVAQPAQPATPMAGRRALKAV